ncbi:MAG: TerB family tellurite resistance protein [Spirulinaceae cyanobacterium]
MDSSSLPKSTSELSAESPVQLSNEEFLAFYGALLAIASADGSVDPEEKRIIRRFFEEEAEVTVELKGSLRTLAQSPPPLADCLEKLALSDVDIQWKLVFALLEVAHADGRIHPEEVKSLKLLETHLDVSTAQLKAASEFIRKMASLDSQSVDEGSIQESIRAEIEKLQFVEIPVPTNYLIVRDGTEGKLALFEALKNNQKFYSDGRFWKKAKQVTVLAGKEAIEKSLYLYYVAQRDDVPMRLKVAIFGALGYFILPFDLVPDVMPGVGFGDDFATMATALGAATMYVNSEVKQSAKQKITEWFG